MPHLSNPEAKERIQEGDAPMSGAELNFAITDRIIQYLDYCISLDGKLLYGPINDILGALEGAKGEFQRQIVDPFEATKATENGNAYPASIVELTWAPKGEPLPEVSWQNEESVSVADATGTSSSTQDPVEESVALADELAAKDIAVGYAYLRHMVSHLLSTNESLNFNEEDARFVAERAVRTFR